MSPGCSTFPFDDGFFRGPDDDAFRRAPHTPAPRCECPGERPPLVPTVVLSLAILWMRWCRRRRSEHVPVGERHEPALRLQHRGVEPLAQDLRDEADRP